MDNPWINRHDIAAVQAELAALQARHNTLLVSAEKLAAANVELGEKLESQEVKLYEEFEQKLRQLRESLVEKVDKYLAIKAQELTAAEYDKQVKDGTLSGASVLTSVVS